jgi:hypothetical protein
MNKKQKIIDQVQELETELENITASGKGTGEINSLRTEVNGLKLSQAFFDRQISTAVYELKTRSNKRELRCFLLKPISLDPTGWKTMLEEEGLQNLTKRKQLNK